MRSQYCTGVFGLGDLVAMQLSSIGITKHRWTDFLILIHWLQPGQSCKCRERQEWLNQLLPRAWRWLRGLVV